MLRQLRIEPGNSGHPGHLLLTAAEAAGPRGRGGSSGADDYAGKPYDRDDVVSAGRNASRDATRH